MSDRMRRREFIGRVVAGGLAGRLTATAVLAAEPAEGEAASKPAAASMSHTKRPVTDLVPLGRTGLRTTRLGMGTGMRGWNHESNQTRLGMEALTKLFRHLYDRGLRYIDCADMYGSHVYLRNAMKQIPREKLTIVTKTVSRDADGVRRDIERFRKELGTDYIDVLLLHCLTDGDWTQKLKGPMDVLSEAKQKGVIKAHGCSCHTLAAIRLAVATPWVEVDLARFNPKGEKMDGPPDQVAPILRQFHARGAGVLCMKILGEGTFKDDETINASLRFVLRNENVSAFCIGFEKPDEIDDILKRCERILA